MSKKCPYEQRLCAFLAGQLTAADEALIEHHVDTCAICQGALAELTEDSSHAPMLVVGDDLVEEPLTPRLRKNVAAAYSAELGTFYSTGSEETTKLEQNRAVEEWPKVPGYEVTGLLGRGGLSVVYRATDQRLKRPVALKIIRQQATPDERERLQREAEALATLRHAGVVQIYEIGEQEGRPFLALEFIGGGSLSRYMSGKPQPPRAAARLVATLAETMQLAHERGLVHRDLKPANVLLSWENETRLRDDLNYCRPKVTDFGLVKNMSVESGLTHSRDLLGTPSYMAPEQAGGDPITVGPACDIWALGAILYELMTGRPPFHGATAVDTLMQVRQSEPVPPSRLQPKLPRDLETICLKCLEKAPSLRYASARDLAEDLNRFRDGQTIQARPVSPGGRALRWCKRNPAVSLLGAIIGVLLLAMAVGGPVAAYREASLRKEANQRATQAEEERARAGRNLDLATTALDDTLKQVYEYIGVRPDTLHDFDEKAWSATIPYLEDLVKQEENTPDLRLRKARATRQLARSVADRGDVDRASGLFQQAINELTALAALDSTRADVQREIGVTQIEYGKFLALRKKAIAEGQAQFQKAIQCLEKLVTTNPNVADYRENLANALSLRGERLLTQRTREEGVSLLSRAATLRRGLSAEFPNKTSYATSEVISLYPLGMGLSDSGKYEEAVATFARAAEIMKKLTTKAPGDAQLLYMQNLALDGVTAAHLKAGKVDEANASMRATIDVHDRLAAAFPASKQFAYTAMQGHELYRQILAKKNDWPAALEHARAYDNIIKKYQEAHPNDRGAKVEQMAITRLLGEMLRKNGRNEEALAKCREAIAIGETLSDGATPTDEGTARILAEACVDLGDMTNDDSAAALTEYERAIGLVSPTEEVPANRDCRRVLKRALMQQAKVLRILEREEDARAAEKKASSIPETNPTDLVPQGIYR